jgi:predicted RNase H-like nuclease
MKWVNPPVAYMLHAGAPLLLDAGVHIPFMHSGDRSRIALEAYPGLVARGITTASYKSDTTAKQTPERHAARRAILRALERGDYPQQIQLDAGRFKRQLVDDGSGDLLDAVLCGLMAAWAWQRRDQDYGLPPHDALEGWIIGA